MNRLIRNTIFLLLALLIVSCSKSDGYKKKLNVPYKNLEPQKLEVVEYNKALFSIDTANFEEGVRSLMPQFQSLLGDTIDEELMMYLKDFVTDTFMLKINKLVEETFPNIELISEKIKGVYQHLNYYYPELTMPQTYTYVSGVYYNRPDCISADYVMIGLDFYLSNKDFVYDRIGYPRYVSRRCQPAALTRDLAEEIYFTFVNKQINQKTVLAEMIERGKKYYFIEAMDPALNDSIILGYSKPQMEWAEDNEGAVWAAVVGNNMLYSNAVEHKRLLFGDGPFTAAFCDDSPARLGDFIGLQIIRSFMANNDETLQDMMKMTDYQDILQRSQYKPRK